MLLCWALPPSILEQFSSAGWGNILLLHNAGAHRLIIIHPIKMDDGRCGVLWMPLNFEPFFGSDLAFILLFRVPVAGSLVTLMRKRTFR